MKKKKCRNEEKSNNIKEMSKIRKHVQKLKKKNFEN